MKGTLLLLRAVALFSVYALLVYGWFVKLRAHGWVVVHNVLRDDGGGNVDHFVSSRDGAAFAIETKAGRLRAADRGQAISNAIWAKGKFGARFVTAVVCIGTDAPEKPQLVRHGNATVWIVCRSGLGDWLRSRTSPP